MTQRSRSWASVRRERPHAADATLAAERAERAAAAQAVAGRARQPSLHAFFARTMPAAAQKDQDKDTAIPIPIPIS